MHGWYRIQPNRYRPLWGPITLDRMHIFLYIFFFYTQSFSSWLNQWHKTQFRHKISLTVVEVYKKDETLFFPQTWNLAWVELTPSQSPMIMTVMMTRSILIAPNFKKKDTHEKMKKNLKKKRNWSRTSKLFPLLTQSTSHEFPIHLSHCYSSQEGAPDITRKCITRAPEYIVTCISWMFYYSHDQAWQLHCTRRKPNTCKGSSDLVACGHGVHHPEREGQMVARISRSFT